MDERRGDDVGRAARSLAVLDVGRVGFVELPVREPGDGDFELATLYSGVSAGTELTFVKGTNPRLRRRWDDELCVFVDGPADAYPVSVLGYMEVARVTATRAPAVAEGSLVAMAYGHKTRHTASAERDRFTVLPPWLDPVLGIFVAQMGPICVNALLHAAYELRSAGDPGVGDGVRGRRVVVVGAGVVGLLTALLARRHGAAEVVVADVTPARRAAAAGLGFEPLDPATDGWRVLKSQWAPGADVVFQCRGNAESLALSLRVLRPQGAVIDLAFYQGGSEPLDLGAEFHHNGLVVRCAQIGRVPPGMSGSWPRERLQEETLALLADEGEGIRRIVVTDLVPFDDGPDLLLALADRRRAAIQAVLVLEAT